MPPDMEYIKKLFGERKIFFSDEETRKEWLDWYEHAVRSPSTQNEISKAYKKIHEEDEDNWPHSV